MHTNKDNFLLRLIGMYPLPVIFKLRPRNPTERNVFIIERIGTAFKFVDFVLGDLTNSLSNPVASLQ